MSRRGNSVTVQKDGIYYKRNITHVKRYEQEQDSHTREQCENLKYNDVNEDRDDYREPAILNDDDCATDDVKLRSRFDDFVIL